MFQVFHSIRSQDEDKEIELENVGEFLDDVYDAFFGSGVMPQIRAFKKGFKERLGDSILNLHCLDVKEAIALLCGEEMKRAFTRQELLEGLVFEFIDDGVTREQKDEFRDSFIEAVLGFGAENGVKFLKFITTSNRLPRGVLKELSPRMTMTVGQVGFATPDALPRTHTYFNQIKILAILLLRFSGAGLHML